MNFLKWKIQMNILCEVFLVFLISLVSYFVLGRPNTVLLILLGGISGWALVKLISRVWSPKR